MNQTHSIRLIEFKGTTIPAIAVTVRSLAPDSLRVAAQALFGSASEAFFAGSVGFLDLSQLIEKETVFEQPVDWQTVRDLFDTHGLRIIGVRGTPACEASARAAGLAVFPEERRQAAEPARREVTEKGMPVSEIVNTPTTSAPSEPAPPKPPEALVHSAQVIDRPLRSGQQIHAQGKDLVVLAAVNPGAEIIADGSIHVYAPLRGRALAGARGKTDARIFTTCFAAELVSIAGIYRTFENGTDSELTLRPVQVRSSGNKLILDPLKLD